MNFVIFSYHFLPLSSAEAFCTTRFASALVSEGHNVHVVTMDWPQAVSQEVYDFLVDNRLKITRVQASPQRCSNLARMRYMTTEWESRDYPQIIEILKNVLDLYDNPILISRSMPETSHIVAWYCRKHAAKWIVHFSDPTPFEHDGSDIKNRLWTWLSRRWVRKALRRADGVSLTCETAKRFFAETYGDDFRTQKVNVTNHIGEPALPVTETWNKECTEKIIVHSGMLYGNRGEAQMAQALAQINHERLKLRFVQIGECGNNVSFFANRNDVDVLDSTSPSVAAAIFSKADISYIPDVQIALPYTPFMPSKFVYQLFSDKPLILYTRKNSPMHRYFVEYPDSGLYFADYTVPGELEQRLAEVMEQIKPFSREAIRRPFTRHAVAQQFVDFSQTL